MVVESRIRNNEIKFQECATMDDVLTQSASRICLPLKPTQMHADTFESSPPSSFVTPMCWVSYTPKKRKAPAASPGARASSRGGTVYGYVEARLAHGASTRIQLYEGIKKGYATDMKEVPESRCTRAHSLGVESALAQFAPGSFEAIAVVTGPGGLMEYGWTPTYLRSALSMLGDDAPTVFLVGPVTSAQVKEAALGEGPWANTQVQTMGLEPKKMDVLTNMLFKIQ